MKFQKPALKVEQQIALWKARGLTIEDENEAAHFLRFVGYYRLSGYALPLTHYHQTGSHTFKTGTTFASIRNLYAFDRDLRLLIMDAIEPVEVAFRTCIFNTMALKGGSHWYMDSAHFHHTDRWREFNLKVAEETGFDLAGNGVKTKGREVFLHHYFQKYTDPKLPPVWMVAEVLSLTVWSKLYECLKAREDRKKISLEFGLNPEVLESWMHAICYLRNLCAHHSRLWNREFTIRPMIAKGHENQMQMNNRFYAQAYVIKCLMQSVAPKSLWWVRLNKFITDHPFIDQKAMGFPA